MVRCRRNYVLILALVAFMVITISPLVFLKLSGSRFPPPSTDIYFVKSQKAEPKSVIIESSETIKLTPEKTAPKETFTVGENLSDIKSPEARRQQIKFAFQHAWNKYDQYAWGTDELNVLGKSGKNWMPNFSLGFTIVDALDTAYIMGLMDEYTRSRQWILDNIKFERTSGTVTVSTFETTIRILGGLLSAYALTGETDKELLDVAEDVGKRLLKAFKGTNKMPLSSVNLFTGVAEHAGWLGQKVVLSEVGTIQLEFLYLAKVTKKVEYATKVHTVVDILDDQPKPNSLYPTMLQIDGKLDHGAKVSMGALGDSWYEYLLKCWLLTNKKIPKFHRMYQESIEGVQMHMVDKSYPDGLVFVSEVNAPQNPRRNNLMDHLACFSGGMFALGAVETKKGSGGGDGGASAGAVMQLGEEVTKTCHETYKRMPTGLGPEQMRFYTDAKKEEDFSANVPSYILRPETVESYFYLWRLTHDEKYREWGWEAFMAIEKNCKTPHGYSGIRSVTDQNVMHDGTQQSFFLAETLKYLYLLFSDDDLVSLNDYVFNTEAHPLKIFKEDEKEWLQYMGSDKLW